MNVGRLIIPGYAIVSELHRGHTRVVYRARAEADGIPVIVKTHPGRVRPREARASLQREADMLGRIKVEGVPRVVALELRGRRPALILEDLGGDTLSALIHANSLSLSSRLTVARNLVRILTAIHARRIVHRDISPANMLVNAATLRGAIIDFGLAIERPTSEAVLPETDTLEGTPAYVSPEQTGRTGWGIDHRSDLYSFGASLYELFTGRRPFDSEETLEVIHAHIALQPTPLEDVNAQVPATLGAIILKLMAKSPHDRYQTAAGLEADLSRCVDEFAATGAIQTFDPGSKDFGDHLAVPTRLYGREKELTAIGSALARVKKGAGEFLLIAGYSGIGKTSLARELAAPTAADGGRFVTGKFDQLVRGKPYRAIREAFAELAGQLLMESDDEIEHWRRELLGAIQPSGRVILDVLPEFEPILGPQPQVPVLGPTESQNRFNRIFRKFLSVFARPDRPLVLFLDDLQWIDSASMDLLLVLLDGGVRPGLLVIGAYRDNEVDDDHMLTNGLGQLEDSGARLTRVVIPPLSERSLRRFVVDTLRGSDAHAAPLADLIGTKTGGNPFFVGQFMKSLAHARLLQPDQKAGVWTYDLEGIREQPITDNVIDLLASRIGSLPKASREVLEAAACLGNRFDETTLAIAWGRDEKETRTALRAALLEGLVVTVDDDSEVRTYRFLHDRVQQAAYALIPESERPDRHVRIGRFLLGALGDEAREDRAFELVDHFRHGLALLSEGDERRTVSALAVVAGQKARAAAAYLEALEYFGVAKELLSPDVWASEQEDTFDLHLCIAECEYLSGRSDDAFRSFELLDRHAKSPLDCARIQILRALQYETTSNYVEAVGAIRAGLAPLGIDFPDRDDFDRVLERELDDLETALGDRDIASLIDLPPMDDPVTKMCMRLLASAWSGSYILGDRGMVAWIPTQMVRLSLAHGNTEESAYGYVAHGFTLGDRRGDYERGQEFGLLALRLNDVLDDIAFRGKVHELFGCFVNLWRRPLVECIESQRTAFLAGIEGGDFAYGTYGGFVETWYRFLTNDTLDVLEAESAPTLDFLRAIHNEAFVSAERLILNWALALRGLTSAPEELNTEGFSEDEFLERHREPVFFQAFYHVIKLHLHLTLGQYDEASAAAQASEPLIHTLGGTIWPMLLRFYGAVARASLCGAGAVEDQEALVRRLDEDADLLGEWACNCPENFSHAELLVRAEISRISAGGTDTEDLYLAAIEAAGVRAFPGDIALANERYARYWLERGQSRVGSLFLLEALRAYDGWGASPRAEQLGAELSGLVAGDEGVVNWGDTGETMASPASVLATLRSSGSALDFEWALKAAGAIASEIELDKLLQTLMRTLLESAGAERGCLILEKDGDAFVRVHGDATTREVVVQTSPAEEGDLLPVSVLRYVRRAKTHVILDDASADSAYATDPYVQNHQPRSMLCLPILYQNKQLGEVYLENNLHIAAFTNNHLHLLKTLSAHAAIAIRNAELFDEVTRLEERVRAENVYLQEKMRTQHEFEEIIGESPALMRVLKQVEQVAPTDSTVLITGETGTGKELLARAIHRLSPRNEQPLVTVNCGAISPGLIESELFGHEKGAFTGATSRKIGRFELADGGTILLDEIGDLALDLQVRLLRVLQEDEIERVGGSETIPVDVRVIAGTHRDLERAMEQGEFRPDLYYRLNVFPITNPPLRERVGDIPLLVRHFVMNDGTRLGKKLQTIPKKTMDAFLKYSWPGNVRELRNVIERCIITSRGPSLELGNWLSSEPAGEEELNLTLDDVQRKHIVRMLRRSGWVVSGPKGAARRLGLKPTTLEARMRKLGIARPRGPAESS